MKAVLTILCILTLACFTGNAQSLQLMTLTGTPVPNGGTISVMMTYADTLADIATEVIIKNISSTAVTVKARKIVKSLKASCKSSDAT